MPTLETWKGVYLWNYIPSLPLAITFAILFGLVTTILAWKTFKTRTWFCLPFVIGGIFDEIGYLCRAFSTDHTGSLALYILQATFLLLPPILFAASLYMTYSRLVRALQAQHLSPLSPRWTTLIFVAGDWVCLNVQSSGAGLLAKPSHVAIGTWIIVAGLALQIGMFAGFGVLCVLFHARFPRFASGSENAVAAGVPWRSCLYMLYGTSAAILVRNIYRVVEFVMGKDGYLQQTEWPVYVFDAALMLLVMLGFLVWYPSELRPRPTHAGGDFVLEDRAVRGVGDGSSPSPGSNSVVDENDRTKLWRHAP